jgi:hypothetical protein
MDRQMIVDRLRLAEQHVKDGEAIVERQRVLVALLTAHGHPTTMAKELLAQFTRTLDTQISDRDRLQRELAAYVTGTVG